jgi:hypothetical protein
MDSDEVNSFSDTAESRQVAQVIRTTYFNILARSNLPEHKAMFSLNASGSAATPVLMIKPDNVSKIEWIKYNKFMEDDDEEPAFAYVTILPLQQFMDMMHQINTDEADVDTMTLNDVDFTFRTDLGPCYCTIVDDYYIVFDAYDSEVDTTLQSSKTLCFGQTIPSFTFEDGFIPELDEQQFPLLLNEAKALAFYELKQMPHQKAEMESKRQWTTLQRTKALGPPTCFEQLPNFGRIPSRGRIRWN